MIATGLCVMGGCFAMDNGAAVDTYWPAAAAVFSPEVQKRYVKLLDVPFYGGGSEYEYCSFRGVFQNVAGHGEWIMPAGVAREGNSMAGAICVSAHTKENDSVPMALYCSYNTAIFGFIEGSEPMEFSVSARNSSCHCEVTGVGAFDGTASFTIREDRYRNVRIHSVFTTGFHWFEYGNYQTGFHFCITAMKSAGGASALFTDCVATLLEV